MTVDLFEFQYGAQVKYDAKAFTSVQSTYCKMQYCLHGGQIVTMFLNYEDEFLLFVYSKKHDKTPRVENRFRYELPDKLPKFKGKEYTSAIIVGKQFNPETAKYFEVFDDAVVLGVGTINDIVAGGTT